eukprot:3213510-Rhodomonas_salina.1
MTVNAMADLLGQSSGPVVQNATSHDGASGSMVWVQSGERWYAGEVVDVLSSALEETSVLRIRMSSGREITVKKEKTFPKNSHEDDVAEDLAKVGPFRYNFASLAAEPLLFLPSSFPPPRLFL